MALNTIAFNDTMGKLTLIDGTSPTPVELVLLFDNGDFSITGIKKVLRETEKYERRGQLQSVGLGSRIYPSGSFSCMVMHLTTSDAGIAKDFFMQDGAYTANTYTAGGNDCVYTTDIKFELDGTKIGIPAETFTLHDCDVTIDMSEGRPNAFSFSFEVLGEVSGSIVADE
ncbi:MAG: hypothetical protein KAJ19_23955 [Gammaproteobacteria bacterium]|jgi:hypothetical protein|nr:hypothetical protein [Gammaproteobacteria bacterium]